MYSMIRVWNVYVNKCQWLEFLAVQYKNQVEVKPKIPCSSKSVPSNFAFECCLGSSIWWLAISCVLWMVLEVMWCSLGDLAHEENLTTTITVKSECVWKLLWTRDHSWTKLIRCCLCLRGNPLCRTTTPLTQWIETRLPWNRDTPHS